jgi:hypothetical protein
MVLVPALVLCVIALHGAPSVTPDRAPLSTTEMSAIVGGAGTAVTGIPFPQNFVISDFDLHKVKWNEPGNRCQYNCGTLGPSNVGFDSAALIAQPTGGMAPRLEIYADGKGRAFSTASYLTTISGYDLWNANLITKCKGGTNNNKLCHTNSFCTPGGGICSACDQAGNCNGDGMGADDLLPCRKICRGDSTDPEHINGKFCTSTFECGSGSCDPAIESGAQTCYLLGRCGSGTDPDCAADCVTSGAKADGAGGGPFHTAMIRILSGGGNELMRDETVFRMVQATGFPTGLCDGDPE